MSQLEHEQPRIEALLDLLAAEVAERLKAQHMPTVLQPISPEETSGATVPVTGLEKTTAPDKKPSAGASDPMQPDMAPVNSVPVGAVDMPSSDPAVEPDDHTDPDEAPAAVLLSPPGVAAHQMLRLALGLLIAIVLINIPLNAHGVTLATAMPDSASLVIRDGLVVKERDSSDIYVYQQEEFRWITSLDAFEHYGYSWRDVRDVEPGFLDRFRIGAPLHVLLKCEGSPHIYRAERGAKRWIIDIATLEAEGHVWEDVRTVSCTQLRSMPDGETIPPGHGPPPQP